MTTNASKLAKDALLLLSDARFRKRERELLKRTEHIHKLLVLFIMGAEDDAAAGAGAKPRKPKPKPGCKPKPKRRGKRGDDGPESSIDRVCLW